MPRSALFAVVAIALPATPLAAASVGALGSTAARVVAGMTEPGAMLVWGTVLAGLAQAIGRRIPKK